MSGNKNSNQNAFSVIQNHGYIFVIVVFVILPIWAFWDTYWLRKPREYIVIEHLHAIPSIVWCLFITIQTYLIKVGQLRWHKSLGQLSYILAPAFLVSSVTISWGSLTYAELTDSALYMFAVRSFLILMFTLFFSMAILNKKKPTQHAHWMFCSVIVLIDPVLNRITDNFIYAPYVSGIHQLIAFGVMDLIVIFFFILEARAGRKSIFLPVLLLLLVGQILVLAGWDTTFWRQLTELVPDFPYD